MNNDKIISKMQKLLALSQSTANEHEAMSAARKLHAMLAKYNVSMTDLDRQEEQVGASEFSMYDRPWKRVVAMYVAELYFCTFYLSKTSGAKNNSFTFVGTEANRTFAGYIFQNIVSVIERESRRESKALYGKEVSSFVNSFWTGARDRIMVRCKELIDLAKKGELQDDDGTMLPALLSTYELTKKQNDEFLNLNVSGLRNKSAKSRADNAAGYSEGQEAGNRVQLSRAIQGKAAPKMIGG